MPRRHAEAETVYSPDRGSAPPGERFDEFLDLDCRTRHHSILSSGTIIALWSAVLRAVVVVVGCLLGTVVVPHRPAAPAETSAVRAEMPAVRADKADSVHVERRLITVEAVAVEPARIIAPATKKASHVKRTDTARRPFVARAARLVLGDGRFRPEPFPRPAVR